MTAQKKTLKKASPKPQKVTQKAAPKLPLPNYDLKFDIGELYPGQPIIRAKAQAKDSEIGDRGYGVTEVEAAKDFIRRNPPTILDKVFEKK